MLFACCSSVCDKNAGPLGLVAGLSRVSLATPQAGGQRDTARPISRLQKGQSELQARDEDEGRWPAREQGARQQPAPDSSGTPEPSDQSAPVAHFNLAKMPRVVFGSAYQSEVYLPCQILNLDDDQTVSVFAFPPPETIWPIGRRTDPTSGSRGKWPRWGRGRERDPPPSERQ